MHECAIVCVYSVQTIAATSNNFSISTREKKQQHKIYVYPVGNRPLENAGIENEKLMSNAGKHAIADRHQPREKVANYSRLG